MGNMQNILVPALLCIVAGIFMIHILPEIEALLPNKWKHVTDIEELGGVAGKPDYRQFKVCYKNGRIKCYMCREGSSDYLRFRAMVLKLAGEDPQNWPVDWQEQAVRCAKELLIEEAFSRKGLKARLEAEGYAPEQAEYAIKEIEGKTQPGDRAE